MALRQHHRTEATGLRSLSLPPPFRTLVLREVGDAFAHACAHAVELGAGTLVFVGRFDLAEFAVVLEPEEPLTVARPVFYAGMAALANALAALAPPEKPIAITWPDAILVDGGLVGGGRLGWPTACAEGVVPDWLVFGAAIRTVAIGVQGGGLSRLGTALEDEGFGTVDAESIAEGFARHLMAALDRWREAGLAAIAGDYVARLPREDQAQCTIADNGDLDERRPRSARAVRRLAPLLAIPSWLDPENGGPRA
jgi:hypothetical protein